LQILEQPVNQIVQNVRSSHPGGAVNLSVQPRSGQTEATTARGKTGAATSAAPARSTGRKY
jgi:hypothetical protein